MRYPESRLTGNLGTIRNLAEEDDIMVFQRNLENLDLYRLVLVKQGIQHYIELAQILPSGRWGVLFDEKPVSQKDINRLEQEEKEQESQPFKLFEEERRKIETKSVRTARSIVFRYTIRQIYNNKCIICNTGMMTPTGIVEIEASHIVPKKFHGSDDARNGLSLCRRHHWAFDEGLFGIDENYKVIVPRKVSKMPCNSILTKLEGSEIIEPSQLHLRPDSEALHWHRSNTLIA